MTRRGTIFGHASDCTCVGCRFMNGEDELPRVAELERDVYDRDSRITELEGQLETALSNAFEATVLSGNLALEMDEFQRRAEKLLETQVMTHEFTWPETWQAMREALAKQRGSESHMTDPTAPRRASMDGPHPADCACVYCAAPPVEPCGTIVKMWQDDIARFARENHALHVQLQSLTDQLRTWEDGPFVVEHDVRTILARMRDEAWIDWRTAVPGDVQTVEHARVRTDTIDTIVRQLDTLAKERDQRFDVCDMCKHVRRAHSLSFSGCAVCSCAEFDPGFPPHVHAGDAHDPDHCVWTRPDGVRCAVPVLRTSPKI